ncbi:MAG TPA: hypothetical protein VLQ45_21640 [Thermoanaerobaculia bacterium]|nr:hypothetical protein [Thermoanaerobaculia bacterium]
MRQLEWKVCFAVAVLVLGFLAVPAQAIDLDGDGRDDGPWIESVPLDADADADGSFDSDSDFDFAAIWVLVCPPGCVKVRTVNHHGEIDEFCDCNGDGQQDQACQIWLKTYADGTQKPICHPGCPGEGRPGGQQCAMYTEEKPDGGVTKWCNCV